MHVVLSSYLPETIQTLVLKDSRLARQHDEPVENIDAEDDQECLGAFTWQQAPCWLKNLQHIEGLGAQSCHG
eukprot:852022-Amphidinium_carterae.2